jgi:hypothetical protein
LLLSCKNAAACGMLDFSAYWSVLPNDHSTLVSHDQQYAASSPSVSATSRGLPHRQIRILPSAARQGSHVFLELAYLQPVVHFRDDGLGEQWLSVVPKSKPSIACQFFNISFCT